MPAAPASSSSPARAASFDNLPTELLKHVVELVKLDRHAYTGLRRGSYQRRTVGIEKYPQNDERLAVASSWSCWYGRELEALSRVNKRLRKLCMQHLVETITYRQLATPFGSYRLPHLAYTSHIRSITLDAHKAAVPYSDVAFLLPHLPGLDSLTADSSMLIRLFRRGQLPPEDAARQEYTIEAFEALSTRLVTLKLARTPGEDFLGDILPRITSSAVLRHLKFHGNLRMLWHDEAEANEALRNCLLKLTALDSLQVREQGMGEGDGPLLGITTVWRDGWRMPSLRHLELSTYATPPNILPFLADALPNLERLSIDFLEPNEDSFNLTRGADAFEPVLWRHLRSFSMTAWETFFLPTLTSLAPCSQLQFIHIEPRYANLTSNVFPATFPSTLRRVVYHCDAAEYLTLESDGRQALETHCADRGVSLEWRLRSGSYRDFSKEREASGWKQARLTERMDDPGLKRHLHNILDWARRRLDHLVVVQDEAGFEEFMTVIRPLEERRYIERGLLYVDTDVVNDIE